MLISVFFKLQQGTIDKLLPVSYQDSDQVSRINKRKNGRYLST